MGTSSHNVGKVDGLWLQAVITLVFPLWLVLLVDVDHPSKKTKSKYVYVGQWGLYRCFTDMPMYN